MTEAGTTSSPNPEQTPSVSAAGRAAHRRRVRRLLLTSVVAIAILVAAATVWALRGEEQASQRGDRLRVVATTNFLTDTVRRVGGDDVTAVGLMGQGVDPHLYRARPSDLDKLRSANLVVASGLHLEGKMQEVFDDISKRTPVVKAAERIPADRLLKPPAGTSGAQEHDPHVWFDVSLWQYVVDAIRDALIAEDPDNAADYTQRAAGYQAELTALHQETSAALAQIPERQRVLVTSHDAFRYFGRAYGVQVEGIQGISTAAEATTADIDRVATLVTERGVKAVFVESSVPKRTLDAVVAAVRHKGGKIHIGGELYSDAAGKRGTPEGTYVGMIRANVNRIVTELR